jgi:excinuclease ABC subunit A
MTLRRALFGIFIIRRTNRGHRALHGLDQLDKAIVIDQARLASTAFEPDHVHRAFTPIALLVSCPRRVRGYDAGRFSFNVKGGRCEIARRRTDQDEMHFLPDVYVECEVCRGQRYNRETLEITFKGKEYRRCA